MYNTASFIDVNSTKAEIPTICLTIILEILGIRKVCLFLHIFLKSDRDSLHQSSYLANYNVLPEQDLSNVKGLLATVSGHPSANAMGRKENENEKRHRFDIHYLH